MMTITERVKEEVIVFTFEMRFKISSFPLE